MTGRPRGGAQGQLSSGGTHPRQAAASSAAPTAFPWAVLHPQPSAIPQQQPAGTAPPGPPSNSAPHPHSPHRERGPRPHGGGGKARQPGPRKAMSPCLPLITQCIFCQIKGWTDCLRGPSPSEGLKFARAVVTESNGQQRARPGREERGLGGVGGWAPASSVKWGDQKTGTRQEGCRGGKEDLLVSKLRAGHCTHTLTVTRTS